MAVGVQVSENLCAVDVEDAVDRDRSSRRLKKIHRLLRGDVEALPIEQQVLARLGDGRRRSGLRDGTRTGNHLAAERTCLDGGCEERQSRRDERTA